MGCDEASSFYLIVNTNLSIVSFELCTLGTSPYHIWNKVSVIILLYTARISKATCRNSHIHI